MPYSIQITDDGQKAILGTHILIDSGLFMLTYNRKHYYDVVLKPFFHNNKPALKVYIKKDDQLVAVEGAESTYQINGNIFLFDTNDIIPLNIIYDNGITSSNGARSPYDEFGNIISILSYRIQGDIYSTYSTYNIIVSDENEYFSLLDCVKDIFSEYFNQQSLFIDSFCQKANNSLYQNIYENYVDIYKLKELFQSLDNISKVEADWSLLEGLDCSYFHQLLLSSEYDRYKYYSRFYPGDIFLERSYDYPKYFKERIYYHPTSIINTNDESYMYSKAIKDNILTLLDLLNINYSDRTTFFWLTYHGLYHTAAKMFAEEFIQKFGNDYKNINDLSVEEIIITALSNQEFDHNYNYNITLLTYYLMKSGRTEDNYNIFNAERELKPIICDLASKIQAKKNQHIMLEKLFGANNNKNEKITIDDVDLMTGQEFEQFVSDYFQQQGYRTEITKASGDQGIDVIAEKGNTRIGIQAKCYSGNVGNSAIQEAVAGKAYYKLDKAMVITNSTFTSSAIELAQANNVVLWDRTILKEKL